MAKWLKLTAISTMPMLLETSTAPCATSATSGLASASIVAENTRLPPRAKRLSLPEPTQKTQITPSPTTILATRASSYEATQPPAQHSRRQWLQSRSARLRVPMPTAESATPTTMPRATMRLPRLTTVPTPPTTPPATIRSTRRR